MHRGVLALLPVLLAGCTDDDAVAGGEARRCFLPERGDWSKETLAIEVVAEGPFSVDVPFPVSSDGTDVSDWVANLSVDGGALPSAVTTGRGQALRIVGEGDVNVSSCAIQPQGGGNGCCAEHYLDAAWTTSPDDARPNALSIRLNSGSASMTIHYAAVSDYCGREAWFQGDLPEVGWNGLRGEDAAWCE